MVKTKKQDQSMLRHLLLNTSLFQHVLCFPISLFMNLQMGELICPDSTSSVLVLLLDNEIFLNDFVQTYKNRIENCHVLPTKNEENQN